MTTKEIIAIVITALVLAVDLITDYRLWLKYRNEVKPEGSVKHKYGAWLRLAGLAAPLVLGWPFLSIAICFVYWVFFDGIMNILMRENFFRIGTTAWLDKQQRKYPIIVWVKYIGLIGSVTFYIVWKTVDVNFTLYA
jgi:hypothetical protein